MQALKVTLLTCCAGPPGHTVNDVQALKVTLLTCAGPEVHTAAGHSGTGAWLESLWPRCSPWGGALWHVSHHFYSLPKGVIIGEGWVGGRREWGDHCACKSKQVEHGGRGGLFYMSICATYLEEGLVLLACKSDPTAQLGGSLFWPFPQGICSLAYQSDHAFHLLGLSRVLRLWSLSNDCSFLLCTLKSFYLLACPAVGTPPTDTKLCGASESMWCAGGTASEASPATDIHLSPVPLSDLLRVTLSDWERQRDPQQAGAEGFIASINNSFDAVRTLELILPGCGMKPVTLTFAGLWSGGQCSQAKSLSTVIAVHRLPDRNPQRFWTDRVLFFLLSGWK